MAYQMNCEQPPITGVESLRVRVASSAHGQPAPSTIPLIATGNDTMRYILSGAVTPVVALATRLGWLHGDFLTPTALTVFSTVAQAGRNSHALAVQNGMLPMIGIGIGSFDSFVISDIGELVHGTHHDPTAATRNRDDIGDILRCWGHDSVDQMPQLHFA